MWTATCSYNLPISLEKRRRKIMPAHQYYTEKEAKINDLICMSIMFGLGAIFGGIFFGRLYFKNQAEIRAQKLQCQKEEAIVKCLNKQRPKLYVQVTCHYCGKQGFLPVYWSLPRFFHPQLTNGWQRIVVEDPKSAPVSHVTSSHYCCPM